MKAAASNKCYFATGISSGDGDAKCNRAGPLHCLRAPTIAPLGQGAVAGPASCASPVRLEGFRTYLTLFQGAKLSSAGVWAR